MEQVIELKAQKESFLGIKEIFSDLKVLPKWFKLLLGLGSLMILFFNFFDIQGGGSQSFFVPINQYNAVLAQNSDGTWMNYSTFGHSEQAALAVTILYCLNGMAAFTGVLMVAMIVYARPSQYFWGLVNSLFTGLFVLSVGYVGDFFMNVIKLITAIPAWWLITNLFKYNKLPNKGKGFNILFWSGIVAIAGFVIMMWLFFIPEAAHWIFSNDEFSQQMWGPQHVLDGMTAGAETIGYTFQMFNIGEQFFVWYFVDILKFLKFTNIAPGTLSINMLLQFAVFFSLDFAGVYERVIFPFMVKKGWKKAKSYQPAALMEENIPEIYA